MRIVFLVLVSCVFAGIGATGEPAAQVPELPADVVTAWEKAGASVGWMSEYDRFGTYFRHGNKREKGEVPAFGFHFFLGVPKPDVLSKLPRPGSAFGLDCHWTDFTDADLKELAELRKLQSLALGGTKVTDAGLKQLNVLENLQWLNLRQTNVTDAGLKELARLKNLKTLGLHNTQVTGSGFKALAGTKNLQSLHVGSSPVTDAGLKDLVGLQNLRSLTLCFTKVTDVGLKDIAALKSLEALDLMGTRITDAGLKELAVLKNLRRLNVAREGRDSFPEVTKEGVAELQKALPNLMIVQ